jgi:hypothetical protein
VTSERTGRIFGLSLVAWFAMIGVMAVMAGVKWNEPGFRDPDITSALEMAMTFGIVMAVPFAGVAFGLLAPMTIVADRVVRGRLPRAANMALGCCLSVPAAVGFVVTSWLLFGGKRNFSQFIATIRRMPDSLISLLIVFAVGGIIVSLGMRRRTLTAAGASQRVRA